MNIFDRFRSAAAPPGKPDTSGQDATRLIDKGHALEAEGKLDEAMQCYLEAIRLAPNPARGHLNRGNVLLLQGDLDGALDAFRTALDHQPDYAGAHYNIGNALLGNRQFDAAVASYRSALEINPDYAEVHCSLGVALKELGQFDEAVACFRRALKLKPDLSEAHTNLDVLVRDIFIMSHNQMDNGQLDSAVANFSRVLEIKPDYAEAHNDLGVALKALGQLEDAATSYRRALEIKPDSALAYKNLGVVLHDLGQYESALASYRRALEIKPEYAEAYCNLGIALKELGQLENAAASCRHALEIKPNFAEAFRNLGNVQLALGQYDNAVESCRHALEIKPESAEALCNLGHALTYLGQLDNAMAAFERALAIRPDFSELHNSMLFSLNYTDSYTSSYRVDQARKYGRMVAAKVGARFTSWQCSTSPERLRIGLVSGDFLSHPVGFFLEGLLAHIDPVRIELIAYPTHHSQDELTARIRPYFSAWHPLFGKNDEAAARMIHADGIHVLIDLSGHTGHSRLPVFAWKPAPVQVTWLGYFATTGVAEVDYLLADAVGVPESQQAQFTESIWYLPDTRLCFTAPNIGPPVAALPAFIKGHLTFGCFQNLAKARDDVLELWGKILAALPDATLRVQCKQLDEPALAEQLLQRLKKYGIASARVATHGASNREIYLAAHAEVDIILDTFPYPGGTTTCEALWMGVPTLTLAGDSLLARQGASLLTAAGLPDWIAADEDEYVAKAVAFASDLERLAALRAGLREQVLPSPLFDAPRFARNFEDALWGMWARYQTQQEHPEKS
jgi:protein O-GlcNAc transferase